MFNNRRTLTMEWYLPSPKWMFLINAILILLHVSVAKTLEPIVWDKHLFQSNGPEGFRIEAEINDVIDIICPKINETLSLSSAQYHKFTQVSKQGYENCDLRQGWGARTLLRCNKPTLVNELRLLFQEHTAYPGDPEFKHGRDYYFITTADGTEAGIDQLTGGLCRSHHMKLIIHMNGEGVTGIPSTPSKEGGRFSSPTSSLPARSPTQTSPTESTKLTTTVKPTRRKVTKNKPSNSGKNDEYKGDNDENGSSHQTPSSMLLLICSLIAFVRWLRH